MQASKRSLNFKKALFPAIMTTISFVLFIGVYLILTMTSIGQYYFKGLIFAIPFIFFGVITFFTVTGKLKVIASSVITIILIIVMGFVSLFAFVFMIIDVATTVTTDIGKYERVLKIKGYPNNTLTDHFPGEIPNNAKDIVFSYNPAFLQGGESFGLKFQTDSNSIGNYVNEFSQRAKWIGKPEERQAQGNGIFASEFDILGYTNLPEDFLIYLFYSKPYQPNDWNHGEFSLVAISEQRNEIIFLMEDW